MHPALSDSQIHGTGSKFDIEILEEASYILWSIWRSEDTRYSTLPACIDALSEDPQLYAALKDAHVEGVYDTIRHWNFASGPSTPPPSSSFAADVAIEADVLAFLDELQPTMSKLVSGEITMPVWSPPPAADSTIVSHLQDLRIPCLKGKPNLLLHDLGSFTHESMLHKRLQNIFMPNSHTFLVNTSGSGKTRLLLEGLCMNWGFYFTSLVDSSLLGSSDVQNSIKTYVPDSPYFRSVLPPPGSKAYEAALESNREIAGCIFRRVFLARLMVFTRFAETMQRHCRALANGDDDGDDDARKYKERWLLLQLQPSFVHPQIWDIFDELSCRLKNASDAYINATTKRLLSQVRVLCSSSSPSITGSPSAMFCVLDEAQFAATQHMQAFRSSTSAHARPILRELVKAWEGQCLAHGVFMVVAGTGISKDVVDQAMASAIMKDSRYRWCSNTGSFDDADSQRVYIKRYLPPGYGETREGKRLLERMWYWLQGRHRFTAGFLAELLVNGFRRPHGLLNAYIEHFTQFSVTDATEFIQAEGSEPLPVFSQYKLDFSKLKKNGDMLSTIHQLTTHYLMRAVLPMTLGKDEAIYVEYGFARFLDAETASVAMSEPLVLLAATRWININHRTSYKFFAQQIHLHDPTSNGFENYLAYCIDLIFVPTGQKRRKLNEVFTFNGAAPGWSNQEAELVVLHRTELGDIEYGCVRHSGFEGPTVTLGLNAKSPVETSEWLEHRRNAPICFPHSSMGPDLLFVLRLSDGSCIWVALQAKYSLGKNGSLSRPFLRRAMRSVTPEFFFLDKDGKRYSPTSHPSLVDETISRLEALPHRRADAGKYSLLRVVASFPAQTNLKRCLEEDPDTDDHPIASLDMNLVKQLTRKLSPVDFLQGLEDPLQNSSTGKRKRGSDPSRKSKKLKLN